MGKRYAFGPFVLDPAELSLWRSGKVTEIAPKEFGILVYFVENRHRLLTKDEILETHWPDVFAEESTWTKSLHRLRKALKDNGKAYIQTLPRRGYRFVCPVMELVGIDNSALDVAHFAEVDGIVKPSIETFTLYKQLEEIARSIGVAELRRILSPLPSKIRCSMNEASSKASFFSNLALHASGKLTGPEQNAWFDRLDFELAHIREALDYYSNQDSGALQELELAIALSRFWDTRGYWPEGIEKLRRALARQEPGPSPLKAKGLAWLGWLLLRPDDYAGAKAALLESVAMSKQLDDKECLAFALNCLGFVAEPEGRRQDARSLYSESLELSRSIASHWLVGEALRGLGAVEAGEGNYTAAHKICLAHLSGSETAQHSRGIATAQNRLGSLYREQKKYVDARECHKRSLALMLGTGHRDGTAVCYLNLGLDDEAIGDWRAASHFFQKSLALLQEVKNRRKIAQVMESLGRMAAATDRGEDSARVFGATDSLRELIAAPLSPAEQSKYGSLILSVQERHLSAWREGKEWPLDKAITHALSFM